MASGVTVTRSRWSPLATARRWLQRLRFARRRVVTVRSKLQGFARGWAQFGHSLEPHCEFHRSAYSASAKRPFGLGSARRRSTSSAPKECWRTSESRMRSASLQAMPTRQSRCGRRGAGRPGSPRRAGQRLFGSSATLMRRSTARKSQGRPRNDRVSGPHVVAPRGFQRRSDKVMGAESLGEIGDRKT